MLISRCNASSKSALMQPQALDFPTKAFRTYGIYHLQVEAARKAGRRQRQKMLSLIEPRNRNLKQLPPINMMVEIKAPGIAMCVHWWADTPTSIA
eukprot:scaffold155319_cov32-Prasinocladus_malaysianus.AAC.1